MRLYIEKVFINGLTGMAHGLFATLILGTILVQVGEFTGGSLGQYIIVIGKIATMLTGAGIGVGLATKFGESNFVIMGSAVAGMIGAYSSLILSNKLFVDNAISYSTPGEPLGAFISAFVAIEVAHFISGKTNLDILLTPFIAILSGSIVALILSPYISDLLKIIGNVINEASIYNPFLMSVIVSVCMGVILTLPISSAALSIILNLSGFAAGAATIGCSAQMIGFAVSSFKDNGFSGLITMGLGTSMVQMPNIIKKPVIILPQIISSVIIAPIGILIFKMTNSASGAGMGTSGFVGQIMTFRDMEGKYNNTQLFLLIVLLHIILPAIISLICTNILYKYGFIKKGDMKI